MWEIHSLMLLSLFLQAFLFLSAGLRRRSTSLVLRIVLWLAYLSADGVAIFVLGHLASRASEPRHQLMSFWAPFVLVHLGGQDTITAFSKQDNELWMRHLLSLFTQVAIAGYVVAKASWPNRLLRSAMVLMFLSGCIKYAERTMCLFLSNPAMLRSSFLKSLSKTLGALRIRKTSGPDGAPEEHMMSRLNLMSEGSCDDGSITASGNGRSEQFLDVLFVDVPPNTEQSILAADSLPGLLKEFSSTAGRYGAYDSVGACLVYCYSSLYSKHWLRRGFYEFYTQFLPDQVKRTSLFVTSVTFLIFSPLLLYPFFQHVSTPVALALFTVAQKGDHQLHATSRADITVSYILLVGAIALDVSSVTMFLLSIRVPSAAWGRKKWSEELGQYSMIKRHVVQDTTTGVSSSIQKWFGRRLGGWGVGLLELTQTTITKPVKERILDNLLLHGTRKDWHVASSRGLLAVQIWKDGHQDHYPASKSTGEALEKTIGSVADFPTSVLVWHLATDICYYYNSGDTASTTSSSCDQMNKDREVSRLISNYVMYLVFKCGVKLTPNTQYVHDKAHDEIRDVLSSSKQRRPQIISGGEKAAFMKIFEAKKEAAAVVVEEEEVQDDHSTSAGITLQNHEEPAPSGTDGDSHMQKLLQSAQVFDSPVLPRACELAHILISINEGEADRWGLISMVWSEMLYYAAPRCGGAFHYEHLSTGGEFATHVLALMLELGPFMPPLDDAY